jgi:hypothetical protein
MRFTLAGSEFDINPGDVPKKLQGIPPERVVTHGVTLNGVLFPVKQVISCITGLPKADFNSHQARQILRRMRFEVVTMNKAAGH